MRVAILVAGLGAAVLLSCAVAGEWVWLEAEGFADGNFPYASASTRGVFHPQASGGEYLFIRPGARGRPLDPPGYPYLEWAFRVPAPGDYRYVWVSYGPSTGNFSWTVDGQPPIPAQNAASGGSYAEGRFGWVRLDPDGLDLWLEPGRTHTLTILQQQPERWWIDAILLTTDPSWVPQGAEKPPVDRSYLDVYPDYVVYAKSWLEHVLPDTLPDEGEITEGLWTFATPGEYEPLSFSIFARRDLENVQVRVGRLVGESAIIPEEELDLRVVRVMEKRRHSRAGPEETELVPEILDYNSPQNIPAGTSKQYWLIVHVPQDTPPGTYRGEIFIQPGNAPARELDLEILVLPFTLAPPARHYSLAYFPLREFGGRELPGDPLTYMRQDYQDMLLHGITSPSLYIPLEVSRGPDGSVEIDYSAFAAAMDLLAELGFPGPVHWRGIYHLYRDLKRLGLPSGEIEALYSEAVATVVRLREERGWPEIYFFPVDEPFGHPEKEAEFYYLAPLIKRVPGAQVELSLDGVVELPPEADPYVDVRAYNGWAVDLALSRLPFPEIAAQLEAAGDVAWVYYNLRGLGGRPEFSRAVAGFYLWNSPFSGLAAWTYHIFFGDPYDDLDGPRGDFAYAYPDPDRNFAPTLPTLRWEGFREGVDDLRYLTTLEGALAVAQEEPEKRAAVARAQALLGELKAQIERCGPELRGLLAYLEPEDYQAWRWRIAQAILELSGEAGGGGLLRPRF
ncbi:hypothetical protein DRJ54_00980 [Candidatus Acetothermia bacterium]|nr:MAG: hypothetical protein DRJ54_00980 [Candidatus Acetothermia bacterium]